MKREKTRVLLLFSLMLVMAQCGEQRVDWKVDTLDEWNHSSEEHEGTLAIESADLNGVIDFMGNGALMLAKQRDTLFQKTTDFKKTGTWTSAWQTLNTELTAATFRASVMTYGNDINIRDGWQKFTGNPVVSGGNTLLPLNRDNITDQTILLPDPGGVPQDQAILRGKGTWAGKWLLFFNHTPDKWPHDYYWSFAVADSLAPLKRGINPFRIDTTAFPLFGPIDGQAPNDWLEVDGVYYAPDETHDGESHMWKSEDILNWTDIGPISGITGHDPGMAFDGEHYYLFNESGESLTFNRLENFTKVVEDDEVLFVGDHTGDADLGFFNNRWHMFFDDGPHLHYNIGYAMTTAEAFPYGWHIENDVYGPYIPDQGQQWDNDTDDGNRFGTGDADFAVEGNTLYIFTERPVGAAYQEIDEIYENTGQTAQVKFEFDVNGDGKADESTDWMELTLGENELTLPSELGNKVRVIFQLDSENANTSPLIRSFTLSP